MFTVPLVPLTLTGGLWVRRELIFMQHTVINALNRAAVPEYDEKMFSSETEVFKSHHLLMLLSVSPFLSSYRRC